MQEAVQTSGGAEVLAGRREAPGPVHVDRRHSELVPSAGSGVGQLDALLCGLRDRWGGGGVAVEQTTGVRVRAGSEPRVMLPHQSSVSFSLLRFQRRCGCEECNHEQQFEHTRRAALCCNA